MKFLTSPCVMILEIPIVPSKPCNNGTTAVQTQLRMILDRSNSSTLCQPQQSKTYLPCASTWILCGYLLEHHNSHLPLASKQASFWQASRLLLKASLPLKSSGNATQVLMEILT